MKDKARTASEVDDTLSCRDYGVDTNPTEEFTARSADRDAYVYKDTVYECCAAKQWASEAGARRELLFRKETYEATDPDTGDTKFVEEWFAKIKFWGNYELTDGDMIYGWSMARTDLTKEWKGQESDFVGKVHGDGFSGRHVYIACANKPLVTDKHSWWCCVMPDEKAYRSLREEMKKGTAWTRQLTDLRHDLGEFCEPGSPEEPERCILAELVQHHNLNPSPALAVRQCLDERSVVSAMTGGAGTGKSETLMACIKGVMRHYIMHAPDKKKTDTRNMGKKGGVHMKTPPRACILVTAPTNAQVDNPMQPVIRSAEDDPLFLKEVLQDHPAPWMRLRAQRGQTPPGLEHCNQPAVQKTLDQYVGCDASFACALNSVRVVFATAGMVAGQRRLLLGAPLGKPQTRFALSFVDESSKHSIPVGLDLAAFGVQSLLCGDDGQLRP